MTAKFNMTESECTSSSHGKDDIKASYRKSNKPLMEKRRRTRINSCLMQLKALVLQAMKKDNSQYSKLEKADILELTVKHLRNVQRAQIAGSVTSGDAVQRYRAGFSECAQEVVRFMGGTAGVPDDVRSRVMGHLTRCVATLSEQQQQLHQQQLQQLQQQLQHQGLVGITSLPGVATPHPAFPTPSQASLPAGLHGFPSLAPASAAVLGLLPTQPIGSTPTPSHLASLAAAPTAFQTPPSVNTSGSSCMSPAVRVSAAPVHVALVLTSPPSTLQALPFLSASSAVSGVASSAVTSMAQTAMDVSSSRAVFPLQNSPVRPAEAALSELSLPGSPVASDADSFASSSRVGSPEDFRRRVASPEEFRRNVGSPDEFRRRVGSPEEFRARSASVQRSTPSRPPSRGSVPVSASAPSVQPSLSAPRPSLPTSPPTTSSGAVSPLGSALPGDDKMWRPW